MAFPPPVLDDRNYDDLIAELRDRIAVYAPEWNDLSPSNPGITLLELVAFLGENLLYRFNQIPDATRTWLLRLLQVPLRPSQPARGLVAASGQGTATTELPAGSVLKAGSTRFETEQDLAVVALDSIAMAKIACAAPTDADLVAAAQAAIDAVGADDTDSIAYYVPTALPADPAAPGAQPLDVPSAVDGMLWVALLAPTPTTDVDDLLRTGGPLDGRVLNVGVALDPELASMFEVDPCPGTSDTGGPPDQMEWQISLDQVDPDGAPVYRTLPLVSDSTGGLRRDGVVRLQLPALPGLVGVPTPDAPGAGQFPPEVDDARPVVCWLRAYPVAGGPEIPRLRWVGINAAEVVQAVTAAPEFMGTGTGAPDQVMTFAHQPVQADAAPVVVQVQEQGVWQSWTLVDSVSAYGPDDRVWMLDAEAGTATFGTTLTGRAPQVGERVRALSYRYGGGVDGNLPAATSWQVDRIGPLGAVAAPGGAPLTIKNPIATAGGAPAETLADGMDRIPGEFRRHDRAVTSSDFAELAIATPGSEVGRAECLPLFHPPTRQTDAAGVVTVVVWPRADAAHPDAPQPDRGLLGRVCAYLDARRLVTTELYVVAPAYRTVAVSAAVVVKPGYSADAVRRWVELVVRQYLAPLPPFGPDGHGWPLGRQVFGPELQAAALQVDGVDYLAELTVGELDDDGTSWVAADPVVLDPWEVVSLGAITVVAGTSAADLGSTPTPPDTGGTVVPVPTREDRC